MDPERWPKVMITHMMDNPGDQTKWMKHIIDLTEPNCITIEENVDNKQWTANIKHKVTLLFWAQHAEKARQQEFVLFNTTMADKRLLNEDTTVLKVYRQAHLQDIWSIIGNMNEDTCPVCQVKMEKTG